MKDAPKPAEEKTDGPAPTREEIFPEETKEEKPAENAPPAEPEPAKEAKPAESAPSPEPEAPKEEKPTEPETTEQPVAEPSKEDEPQQELAEPFKIAQQQNQPGEPEKEADEIPTLASKPAERANGAEDTAEKPSEPEKTSEPEKQAEPEKSTEPSKPAEPEQQEPKQESSAPATNGDAVQPHARDDDIPSTILEKGVIYFFFRPRVNVTDPSNVNDIARSYFVLRPIPTGAKLGEGTIGDDKSARLIALPKKVLPVSGKDRFLVFVEKAKAGFQELKDDFMSASDYATKTQGTSHTPPVTPIAEGVYAITSTGRESHLAYMLSIPQELGEVQKDVGLKESGSWIVSAKNPKFPSAPGTSPGGDPGYSQEIMDEFRDLRWGPLTPRLLDYVNTQFLLIGESSGIKRAFGEGKQVGEKEKEETKEEIERLEGEDEIRVKHLKGKCEVYGEGMCANRLIGDDAVFADLGISKKEYPQVPSTW